MGDIGGLGANRIQISIKNFQAVSDVSFEVEGFTTIHGESEIGKSAVLRALGYCLTNKTGSEFIRHGQESCYVMINFVDKNFKIEWFKTQETGYYIINDDKENPYANLGGNLPQPILDFGLGVFKTEVTNTKYHPQICSDQFRTVFFLFESPPVKAELLSEISNITKVVSARKLASKDMKSAKVVLKEKQASLAVLEERYVAVDKEGLDLLWSESRAVAQSLRADLEVVNDCEEAYRKLQVVQAFLQVVRQPLYDLQQENAGLVLFEMASLVEEHSRMSYVLDGLRNTSYLLEAHPPDITWYLDFISDVGKFNALLDRVQILRDLPYEDTDSETSIQDYTNFMQVCSEYLRIGKLCEALREVRDVDSTEFSCDVGELGDLLVLYRTYQEVDSVVRSLRLQLEVEDTGTVMDYIEFTSSIKDYNFILEAMSTTRAELGSIDQELSSVLSELSEFSNCPFCNSELEGAHSHGAV